MHILIFTGGQAPFPQNTAFFFAHAPAVDFVVAVDSGLDTLEAYRHFYDGTYNFKPCLIMGDLDSIKDRSLLQKYSHVRSEIYNRDKDFTDTELALQFAVQRAPSRSDDMITLLGGDGGRTDHLIAIYDTFSTPYHADVWLTSTRAVCCIPGGYTLQFTGVNTEETLSFARTTDCYSGSTLETEGLEWESPVFRKCGMPSVSNRIKATYFAEQKPVKLTASGGTFLAFLPLNANVTHIVPASV